MISSLPFNIQHPVSIAQWRRAVDLALSSQDDNQRSFKRSGIPPPFDVGIL
jgi:hypothetical protein